jgi:hypothetical protein
MLSRDRLPGSVGIFDRRGHGGRRRAGRDRTGAESLAPRDVLIRADDRVLTRMSSQGRDRVLTKTMATHTMEFHEAREYACATIDRFMGGVSRDETRYDATCVVAEAFW